MVIFHVLHSGRWEASHIPKVKVAKLDRSKLNNDQTVYMPKIPDIARCPEHLLPLKQWEDAFLMDFSELRLVSSSPIFLFAFSVKQHLISKRQTCLLLKWEDTMVIHYWSTFVGISYLASMMVKDPCNVHAVLIQQSTLRDDYSHLISILLDVHGKEEAMV